MIPAIVLALALALGHALSIGGPANKAAGITGSGPAAPATVTGGTPAASAGADTVTGGTPA